MAGEPRFPPATSQISGLQISQETGMNSKREDDGLAIPAVNPAGSEEAKPCSCHFPALGDLHRGQTP